MTLNPQSRAVRLSLSILAAISIAACSDKSSPTGVSPLPPVTQLQPAGFDASTSAAPTPTTTELGDIVAEPPGLYDCRSFENVNLRAVVRGTDVIVKYAVDGVPRTAFYWVRFWPEGRHTGEYIDEVIGMIDAGQGASGQFVALSFDDIDEKVTLNYNIDLDIAENEEEYRRGVVQSALGQCDRGGALSIEPPPKPECGERNLSIDGMKLERIDYGNVRLYAYAYASNFKGTVELEWTNMGHTELVASAAVGAECNAASVELDWETDRSWARHATFVVRILDQSGRVVASKTYKAGALKNGRPDTWILT